jgi:predicted nucleotide-binding protein
MTSRQEKIVLWGGMVILALSFGITAWPLIAFFAWYVKRIPERRLPLATYLASNQTKFYDWLSDFLSSWLKLSIYWSIIFWIAEVVLGMILSYVADIAGFPLSNLFLNPVFVCMIAYLTAVIAILYSLSNTIFLKWKVLFWQAEPAAKALVGNEEYETMSEEEKNRVKRNIVDSMVGINKATIAVAGGKIQTHNLPAGNLARFGGTGILIVQEGHAVVLERGGRRSRIVGTGVWHLGIFERINMVIPLSQRTISIEIQNVLTEDRVLIMKIKLLAFTKLDEGDKSHANGDFPFDDKVINNLVWSPKLGPVYDWSGAVKSVADTASRDLVARLMLDELVLASGQARDTLRANLKDAINRITKEKLGVVVGSVVIGEIVIPEMAQQKLLERWLIAMDGNEQKPIVPSAKRTNKVFLVHGHDNDLKETVARFLMRLQLEPVILHEQPNKGRTIIEKFEDYSIVPYAVILLTPDDVSYAKEDPANLHPRARQNVVLELGFFVGRLGRDRVCAIYKGDLEIPSDYSGVLYISVNDNWQMKLIQELKAAGFPIDTEHFFGSS